jgi:hypothetical protein
MAAVSSASRDGQNVPQLRDNPVDAEVPLDVAQAATQVLYLALLGLAPTALEHVNLAVDVLQFSFDVHQRHMGASLPQRRRARM